MNRIVLIGNGFDLAHGLKTSYADFIEWYWTEWGKKLLDGRSTFLADRFCSFKLRDNIPCVSWLYVWSFYYSTRHQIKAGEERKILEIAQQDKNLCDYTVSSLLFEKICKHLDKGWVDIEEVYYAFLKSNTNPKQINDDLEFIKEKLIEYLNSLPTYSFNPTIPKQILAPISKEEIAIESTDRWKEMIKNRLNYDNRQWHTLIDSYYLNQEEQMSALIDVGHFKEDFKVEIHNGIFNDDINKKYPAYRLPDSIMLLNFNYTDTADRYLPTSVLFSINHIHGSLSNPESVIFGYGDERDDEYNVLIKKNDNEYLQHIKSFRYLEASNYRNMLSFIESAPYQVCIMGHSCGLSDRTLLSTLFEHPNCVSIKPYYYKKEDGTDNYRELVQNIARNFTDPRLMRDRVVGKERCEALGKVKEG